MDRLRRSRRRTAQFASTNSIDARKEVFGGVDVELLATERITTEHNCVPRDVTAVGDVILFGYNVHFGLKTERNVGDVFSAYTLSEGVFHRAPLDVLGSPEFERDFREIFRYYKDAVFSKFGRRGPYLYMLFQIGRDAKDIKAFKWAVDHGKLTYIDNRSEHEFRFPSQHDFEWMRTTRDDHRGGRHPHVSIEDRVFVETVGGDLTIKIENNTDSGEGVYAEPVDHPDQTLDDAEISYASFGHLILLKVKPYQEAANRYLIFNEKLQTAQRLDAIAQACVFLPEDHGLIFADGYYLHTGECKTFGTGAERMLFEERIASPNGEDYLYVFYNRADGAYQLLRYNMIEQRIDAPIACHGYLLLSDGASGLFPHAGRTEQAPRYTGVAYAVSRGRRPDAGRRRRFLSVQSREPGSRPRHGRMPRVAPTHRPRRSLRRPVRRSGENFDRRYRLLLLARSGRDISTPANRCLEFAPRRRRPLRNSTKSDGCKKRPSVAPSRCSKTWKRPYAKSDSDALRMSTIMYSCWRGCGRCGARSSRLARCVTSI